MVQGKVGGMITYPYCLALRQPLDDHYTICPSIFYALGPMPPKAKTGNRPGYGKRERAKRGERKVKP